MPDQAILGAVARRLVPPSTMPERERQRIIRRHPDRLQRTFAPVSQRDVAARQAAAYANKRLAAAGDALTLAYRRAGVGTARMSVRTSALSGR